MRGVFITGTDTGVGKTAVGTALVWALSQQGLTVRPRKPAESGCPYGTDGLFPVDGANYQAAAGHREPLARICRYRFPAPLSPERAAALQGTDIDLDGLMQACREGVAAEDFLLVEGAGGFYSPLATGVLNADLAVALDLPVLLVTADRLGAIHQVLVTTEAIRRRGLILAGVVLNELAPPPDVRMDNAADLTRWLGCEVSTVRYCGTQQGVPPGRTLAPFLTAVADRMVASAHNETAE